MHCSQREKFLPPLKTFTQACLDPTSGPDRLSYRAHNTYVEVNSIPNQTISNKNIKTLHCALRIVHCAPMFIVQWVGALGASGESIYKMYIIYIGCIMHHAYDMYHVYHVYQLQRVLQWTQHNK